MYTIHVVVYSLHSFSRVMYSESDDFISSLIFLSTDFLQEAKNSERIAKNFKHNKMITIPTVFSEFTTTQVLTMQFCKGFKVSG